MKHFASAGRLGSLAASMALFMAACQQPAAPVPPTQAPAAPSPAAASPAAKPATAPSPAVAASPVAAASPAARPKPTTVVKVVQALPIDSFGFAPLYVAKEKGFFADEGIDLETPIMASSTAAAGIVSGQVDFAVSGTGVRAAMQGAPLKAVFYYYNTTLFELVAKPDITRIQDLKGKTIGTSSPGSTEEITAGVLLRNAGLDPKTDVTFVQVAAGTQLPSLISGVISAMMVNPDISGLAQQQGLKVLTSVQDVGKVMPVPFSGFSVSDDMLQKRPEVLKAWMRANIRALQFFRQNPKESAEIAARALRLDPKVAETAVEAAIGAINPSDLGGFSEEGFLIEIQNNLTALGGQAKTTNVQDLADLRPLREVQREMGVPCRGGYQCS